MTIKLIQKFAILCAVLFIAFMAIKLGGLVSDKIDKDNARIELRAQNGGAIPGEELLGSDGLLYKTVTFEKAPGIECIRSSNYKMFACFPRGEI